VTHPPAFKLDALAAGDSDADTLAHLASCQVCAAYVEQLSSEVDRLRATSDPDAFAETVVRRARRPRFAHRAARAIWVAAPTLAAAALVLWIGHGEPRRGVDAPSAPGTEAPVDLHFKGGTSVVAIRDRGGVQERMTGPFEVQADDRVRLEVAVDHTQPITAGLLGADGSWTPLLAAAELKAGTHYSELAARFDDSKTDAWIVVGAPDAVARARETRRLDGVLAWHVTSKAAP
jgi:hypothetical protein